MIFTLWSFWVLVIMKNRHRFDACPLARRCSTPSKPAAKLKIILLASIYQPQLIIGFLRFRTCLWTCGQTIEFFKVYCKTATKLNVFLERVGCLDDARWCFCCLLRFTSKGPEVDFFFCRVLWRVFVSRLGWIQRLVFLFRILCCRKIEVVVCRSSRHCLFVTRIVVLAAAAVRCRILGALLLI